MRPGHRNLLRRDRRGRLRHRTAACWRIPLYSQIRMHADYGGVVPELASRDHVRKLLPLIRETLREAGMTTRRPRRRRLHRGAGPGRGTAGRCIVARALAWSLEVPAIGVHHMEGHLLAPLLEADAPAAAVRGAARFRWAFAC